MTINNRKVTTLGHILDVSDIIRINNPEKEAKQLLLNMRMPYNKATFQEYSYDVEIPVASVQMSTLFTVTKVTMRDAVVGWLSQSNFNQTYIDIILKELASHGAALDELLIHFPPRVLQAVSDYLTVHQNVKQLQGDMQEYFNDIQYY